jgi:hypothetical protein
MAEIVSVIKLTNKKSENVFRYLGLSCPLKMVRLARKAITAKVG